MKGSKCSFQLAVALILVLAVCGIAMAAAFTMPWTPPGDGMPDKPYSQYTVGECRSCHGLNTADVHHNTFTALYEGCTPCHDVDQSTGGVVIQRNCFLCHETSWHHQTGAAKGGECTVCHLPNLVADAGTGLVRPHAPTYGVSNITPTPRSCSNCHLNFNPDYPAHGPSPQWLSHHELAPNDGPDALPAQCDMCHNKQATTIAPIRACESCHTISTLHMIEGHVVENERCLGCHGDYMANLPKLTTLPPAVSDISTTSGKKYDTLYIEGERFGNSAKRTAVYFSKPDANGVMIHVKAATPYVFDGEIKVTVPNLANGNYTVWVQTRAGSSNSRPFTVVSPPELTKIEPSSALPGEKVTLTGKGFNNGPTKVIFAAGGYVHELNPVVIDAGRMTVTLPSTMLAGGYNVLVSNTIGMSNAVAFTVKSPSGSTPFINNISPTRGKVGSQFKITGSNLSVGTKPVVYFGSTPATITSHSMTAIHGNVPSVPIGVYDVTVNNGTGTSNAVKYEVR